MKYVIFKNKLGLMKALVFPQSLNHVNVSVKDYTPVAAGFCIMQLHGNGDISYSIPSNKGSYSMSIGVGEWDEVILNTMLFDTELHPMMPPQYIIDYYKYPMLLNNNPEMKHINLSESEIIDEFKF